MNFEQGCATRQKKADCTLSIPIEVCERQKKNSVKVGYSDEWRNIGSDGHVTKYLDPRNVRTPSQNIRNI